MSPLTKEQKENIIRRMEFIEIELKDFKEYNKIKFQDYTGDRKVQRQIDRIIENLMNAVIDIAKLILVGDDVKVPATYREAIIELGKIGIVKEEISEDLAKFVGLRNILAHEYLDLRWPNIKDFVKIGPQRIGEFISKIKTYINE